MRGIGALLLLAVAVSAETDPLPCARLPAPPRLDGKLDDPLWLALNPVELQRREQVHPSYLQGWTGPSDLSARVRIGATATHLFLGIEVSDDTLLHEPGQNFWTGDSIEVFFDTDRSAPATDDSYDADDWQLFLLPFHQGLRWGLGSRGSGARYPSGGWSGVEVATQTRIGGYSLEAAIPLSNLAPLRPDAGGSIGFDLALNDVDRAGSVSPETYMTLSGRFDLYRHPGNFGRLRIAGAVAPPEPPRIASPFALDWKVLLGGVGGVLVLTLGVRRIARRIARRTRLRNAALCVGFVAAAGFVLLLPSVVAWIDERLASSRHDASLRGVAAARDGFLRLDASTPGAAEGSGERLLALLRDGKTRIRPRYRYVCVPTSPAAARPPADPAAPGAIRYAIAVEPNQERPIGLELARGVEAIRVDLALPARDERMNAEAAAALLRLESGERVQNVTVRAGESRSATWIRLEGPAETARRLLIRNLLPHRPIEIDALYERDQTGSVRPLPLPSFGPGGVPIDVWRGTPLTHVVAIPARGVHRIASIGQPAERLWFAIAAEGAYPRIRIGGDALEVRVRYAGGEAGPTQRLQNGTQIQDHQVLYAQTTATPERIALEWEREDRIPVHYSLHSIALDPRRPIESVEFEDLGVVGTLRLAAVTLGDRRTQPPDPASGLMLGDDMLTAKGELRLLWEGLGFRVRVEQRVVGAAGRTTGLRRSVPILFEGGGTGEIEVWLPRSRLVSAIVESRGVVGGAAALLFAFAAVVAGAGILHRTTRLRVKMLVALASATAAPLLFLFLGLRSLLGEREESSLREAAMQALRTVAERTQAAKARARDLASRSRDYLDRAPASDEESRAHLARGQRAGLDAEGAFLRLPGVDAPIPSPLGNVSFFDPINRSGLYFSPWDGLVAVGVARFRDARPCIVGLRAPAILGDPPQRGATALLFGPNGEPVASSPAAFPPEFAAPEARAALAERIARVTSQAEPLFEPVAVVSGRPASIAWDVLRDGGQIAGFLGVALPRAETEQAKAAILETLLLAGISALLLVVLAGNTLADRVTLRLRRVTAAARALASGELSRRVPVEAADEVSRLADSFNAMADALDGRVRQLTELHASLESLTSALEPDAVAEVAARTLARVTGARNVTIAGLDPGAARIEILHRLGSGAPLPPRLPDRGPEREAADGQKPHFADGSLFLPLVASGRTVGLALCSSVAEGTLDRAYLGAFGRQIGVAVENARLFRLAVSDEATGVYAHAYFVRRLKEEVDRAAASGRPLSLVRVEIAAFRDLRTRHGAPAAARLLAETAETVDDATPLRMLTARGSEGQLEVLLVEADAEAARKSIEAIAAALGRRSFAPFEGTDRPLFAFHAVTYPRDGASAEILLEALARGEREAVDAAADPTSLLLFPPGIGEEIGRSPAMRAVLDVVARIARTDATVLLTGETGSGKEVLADLLHANGGRRDGPYVKVNCAAIPENLIESELFGHERGAFTGADRRRIGRFEQAHRGTLFLDEIGDLPPAAQVKLLRVLQEKKITRVGGADPIEVDLRILCATHRDLEAAIAEGRFREDLYHRLNVIHIRVPPLRERREEILPLVEAFRERLNRRHGLRIEAFAPDAIDALHAHSWPGNVRELRNVVERSMLLATGPVIPRSQLALGGEGEERLPAAPPPVDGLTPRQERILRAARQSGGISNGDVVESETVSARTALRELQTLVERGLLQRVGRRRGAVYRPPEA